MQTIYVGVENVRTKEEIWNQIERIKDGRMKIPEKSIREMLLKNLKQELKNVVGKK